ncbi:hypothetical protein [Natronospora cellulosivora (SeqCode)]
MSSIKKRSVLLVLFVFFIIFLSGCSGLIGGGDNLPAEVYGVIKIGMDGEDQPIYRNRGTINIFNEENRYWTNIEVDSDDNRKAYYNVEVEEKGVYHVRIYIRRNVFGENFLNVLMYDEIIVNDGSSINANFRVRMD